MQQFGMQQPPQIEKSNGASKVIIVAITLFALSGLMVGLAVGAFTHSHTPPPPTTQQNTHPTPTPAQNVNINALGGIGCPSVTNYTYTEMADGTTNYQLSTTVSDRSIDQTYNNNCGKGKLLKVSGITCKIWVSSTTAANLTRDLFFPATNMQNTFPDEMPNILTFTSGLQVQPCSSTGTTTWSYKLSPTLKAGTYYLGVAADWQGMSWNWSWRAFVVPAPGQ